MTRRIFVNYRRDDSAPHALNVAQYLEREFGGANVFLDIDRLRAGEKFSRVLEERLAASAVMIAIIGPQWLTATDDDGQRRLDDPEDWVRMEISRALARGIPVIPVLVAGAPLPKKGQLPEALRPLIEHHVATLTTNGFRNEMAGLARDIRSLLSPRKRWPFVAAASATVLAAIAAAIFLGLIPAIDVWRTHRDQPIASKDSTTTNQVVVSGRGVDTGVSAAPIVPQTHAVTPDSNDKPAAARTEPKRDVASPAVKWEIVASLDRPKSVAAGVAAQQWSGWQLVPQQGHTNSTHVVAASSDGRFIVSGSSDGSIKVWDASAGILLRTFPAFEKVTSLALTPDGSVLVSGDKSGTAIAWDFATGRRLRLFKGHAKAVSLAIMDEGKTLVTGDDAGSVKVWDLASWSLVRSNDGLPSGIQRIAAPAKAPWFATIGGSSTSDVTLWRAAGVRRDRLSSLRSISSKGLAASDDGRWLLTAGDQFSPSELWDVQTKTVLKSFSGYKSWIDTVAISPNHQFVAAGGREDQGGAEILIWDAQSGELQNTITTSMTEVYSLCFLSDSSVVAGGWGNNSVEIRDVATGHVRNLVHAEAAFGR